MLAAAIFYYGMVYEAMDQQEKAIQYFTQSYLKAEQSGGVILQMEVSDKIFSIYEAKGQADSALKYLRLRNKFSEQVKLEESGRKVLQNEMNEKFIALELLYIQDKRNKAIRNGVASMLALLAVAVLMFLVWRSMKRLQETKLQKQKAEIAARNLSSEKSQLISQIDLKEKQLATYTLQKIQYDGMLEELASKIEISALDNTRDISGNIRHHILKLSKSKDKAIWKEFELRFEKVHVGFYQSLHEKFPNLTPNERRICAFLRLNMTTKEIAEITGKSQHSINIARTRLRKKLHLTNTDTSLIEFLSSF